MNLKDLLKGTDIKSDMNTFINDIKINSKEVKEDDMFIAIKGSITDGHNYINEAILNGAKVIIVNYDYDISYKEVLVLKTKDTRVTLSKIASNYYNNPSKEFKLIGITGTKGKTTTSFMIKKILEESGKKVGLVGTVACYIGNKKLMDSERTTPESIELQSIFRKMADEDCEYVVIEVSSQSLKLCRVDGCDFDIALFTNLSEDHISPYEHSSMKDYFECKCKLFDMTSKGIVNIDDKKGKELVKLKSNCEFISYSIDSDSDNKATNINITNELTTFNANIYGKKELIQISIPGKYTVYNALGAMSICEELGIESKYILSGLKKVRVPGRSELIENDRGLTIMIDYAHSENSLKNVLQAVKCYTKGRVICLFGCGGDRDSRKRPKMAKVSGELADYTIITSDNPRTEDPKTILEEVESGIKGLTDKYIVIVDRVKAIEYAVKMAKLDDIVVLAGKGHERYQIIGHEKFPFDEKEIVLNALNRI